MISHIMFIQEHIKQLQNNNTSNEDEEFFVNGDCGVSHNSDIDDNFNFD